MLLSATAPKAEENAVDGENRVVGWLKHGPVNVASFDDVVAARDDSGAREFVVLLLRYVDMLTGSSGGRR